MSVAATHHWQASDGVDLAYHEMGEGRPVVLLHGLFSSAFVNWIKFGTAERLAAAGFRVIMPDHRAHGDSAKPQEADKYPRGILARDVGELIARLGLDDYDLGGFSLGARTVVQAVGEGLIPRKAILAGMGLDGLVDWDKRQAFFREVIANFDRSTRGDPYWISIQFMKTMKADRVAATHLLNSYGDARPEWFDCFIMPTLVLIGDQDDDNGSAAALAERLPKGDLAIVRGTHMSCVTFPDMGEAMVRFLAG